MAKLEQGILGPFRGKVGTVVGYLWRGRHVVRAYRKEIRYPDTEGQRAEREWFVAMVRMASAARPALRLGLRERAAREQMTEGNWFVRCNKQWFSKDGAEGGAVAVDYGRLRLSEGPVAAVAPTGAAVDDAGVLEVNWQRHNGLRQEKSADEVHCFVYNERLCRGLLAQPARRRDGRLALRLPDGWRAADLHLYLFATDARGRASLTAYARPAPPDHAETPPEEAAACVQAPVGQDANAPARAARPVLPAPGGG